MTTLHSATMNHKFNLVNGYRPHFLTFTKLDLHIALYIHQHIIFITIARSYIIKSVITTTTTVTTTTPYVRMLLYPSKYLIKFLFSSSSFYSFFPSSSSSSLLHLLFHHRPVVISFTRQ